MNQPHSKTIRYAGAGVCVVVVLFLLGWFVLREPPVPANDQPIETATVPPRVRHVAHRFASEDAADRETMTNQVAESPTTNAATIYRQAFALFDLLTDEQKGLVKDWRTNVNAEVEAELCRKIQPICDLMHQAAAVSNCDWEVERPITFETLLPHLSPCRGLARAITWRVAHCRDGDPTGAIGDLVATVRLGQNVSPGVVIEHLVGLAIQGLVIDSAAGNADALAATGDRRLVQLFNDTRYDESLRRAFEEEAGILSRLADTLAAMPPDEAMQELKSTFEADSYRSVLETIEAGQGISSIRQAAELSREWAEKLGLPEAEYHEWLTHLQAVMRTNPIAVIFLGALEITENKTQRATISAAMLVAGFAVMSDGPNALLSRPDPATGRPFTYTQTADGFELQSGYQFKGEPVKLRFK